jgi:hypothetical protein
MSKFYFISDSSCMCKTAWKTEACLLVNIESDLRETVLQVTCCVDVTPDSDWRRALRRG